MNAKKYIFMLLLSVIPMISMAIPVLKEDKLIDQAPGVKIYVNCPQNKCSVDIGGRGVYSAVFKMIGTGSSKGDDLMFRSSANCKQGLYYPDDNMSKPMNVKALTGLDKLAFNAICE